MPITASVAISVRPTVSHARGNMGKHSRNKPNVPSFSSTPASITLPAVGASVCASGNHVCSGNTGTFTMKPTLIARNSATCSLLSRGCSVSQFEIATNEVGDVTYGLTCSTSATKPTSVTTLPANV